MTRERLLRAAILLAVVAPLGGCVAAAIPVIAASGLAGREVLDDDDSVDQPGPGVVEVAAADPEAVSVIPAPPAAAEPGLAAPVAEQPTGDAADSLVPAPAAPAPAGGEALAAMVDPYAAFQAHALAQALRDPVNTPRNSAILATPGTLSPQTTECTILPPAVLVDLDPDRGTFNPEADLAHDAAFAEVLRLLRASNVAVFWISGASAAEAGAFRKALLDSGLDPWGRDGLLLMRRAEDRKQVRRRELAESHCVVAIAGDVRGDFDELYDYLKDPAAAAPLEPLIDAGWFVVPTPIAAKDD